MPEMTDLFLGLTLVIPLLGSLALIRAERQRFVAVLSAGLTLACSVGAALPWLLAGNPEGEKPLAILHDGTFGFGVDGLSALPMVLFAALVTGVLAAMPSRDATRGSCTAILVVLSASLMAYSARTSLTFFVGWTLAALPFFFSGVGVEPSEGSTNWRSRPGTGVLALSVLLLAVGLLVMAVVPNGSLWALGLVAVAAIARKGMFPFQSWVVSAFEKGPMLPFSLLMNAHLGAFLVARIAIPSLPEASRFALTMISDIALVSALYSAFVGLAERRPRRLLARLFTSQTAFILAGLETRNTEGIAGALTFWLVVSVATTGLVLICRILEVRCGPRFEEAFAGLGTRAPRFAVFFAICGLALVGLPGTLGFCAEDLLFHGSLMMHPLLGIALPFATALNAVNVYRLFSTVFLGRRRTSVPLFPDALFREKLVMLALVAFLVVGGVVPGLFIRHRIAPAEVISTILSGEENPLH